MSLWSTVRKALSLLSIRDKRILALLVLIQIFLSLLDLLGIALIGIVVLVSTSALAGSAPSGVAATVTGFVGAGRDPFSLAIQLAVIAGIVLVTKSLFSYFLTRRTFRFLANRQAMIAGRLAGELLTQPLRLVQERSSQQTVLALTRSVSHLTMGVLGNAVIAITEIALLLLLVTALAFVDVGVTAFAALFFLGLAWVVQKFLSGWAQNVGRRNYRAEVASLTTLQEALRSYREIAVAGRRVTYIDRFRGDRWNVAAAEADLRLINIVTKYIYEIALVLGGGLLAVSQFVSKDTTAALTILAIFLAATSRLLPSIMRLQTALVTIRSSTGEGASAISLHERLQTLSHNPAVLSPDLTERLQSGMLHGYPGFEASVSVRDCSLRYSAESESALDCVNLAVSPGEYVALVGSTGAGKSTLADVILGVLLPDTGEATIGGLPPSDAILRWPGAISYVPQDITLVDGSVRVNVALGIAPELINDELVWAALRSAHVADFLDSSRDGLETLVGEGGIRLSGGQRQRLGLARALYTRPQLLVLDEATSALDADTERNVAETLDSLGKNVTRIVVAHRLATVRNADRVVYLEAGCVRAVGTFDEVTTAVPDFHKQARLLGLS